MLQFTPQHRLLLATQPIDFRRGIDGLAACCRQVLEHDPFTGTFFIFTNKRKTAVKILVYDGQGFWLCLNITTPVGKVYKFIVRQQFCNSTITQQIFPCLPSTLTGSSHLTYEDTNQSLGRKNEKAGIYHRPLLSVARRSCI